MLQGLSRQSSSRNPRREKRMRDPNLQLDREQLLDKIHRWKLLGQRISGPEGETGKVVEARYTKTGIVVISWTDSPQNKARNITFMIGDTEVRRSPAANNFQINLHAGMWIVSFKA
jgi:hypothetical protein